uniref:Uncharacterized protein n=1 Tax=Arundo donax TaxID=35708 RepID=A0A0A9G0T4_ARUDO
MPSNLILASLWNIFLTQVLFSCAFVG